MKKTYKQITAEERDKIAVYKAGGYNCTEIALMLGRDRSSIWRELKRNGSRKYGRYTALKAQLKVEQRKIKSNRHLRLKNEFIRTYVEQKLREEWSPEMISGRLKRDHPPHIISPEAIYQYIYLKNPILKYFLVRHHKNRKRKYRFHNRNKIRIPSRTSIDLRPKKANQRKELGHWEADAIVSRQSPEALSIVLERLSRLTKIRKIDRNSAENFSTAIIQSLNNLPRSVRKTITYDNGKENTQHQKVNKILKTRSFFCDPYHSWEKGSVENTIGLVRRYFPKKTDFAKVPLTAVLELEHRLNSRPRKCLQFRTPYEVFNHLSVALAS